MARPAARLLLLIALAFAPCAAARAQSVLVKAETLTLRAKANPKGEKIQTLNSFEPVEILKASKEWSEVRTTSGATGWVLSEYLTQTPFVSVKTAKAAVKIDSSDKAETVLELTKNFPLKVLKRKDGGWLKIVDCDGDSGWLFEKNASFDQYVITHLSKPCNVRKGPSTDTPVVFTCEQGNVLKALEEKDGWIHVKHPDGDEGWVSGKIVFGWLDKDGKLGQAKPNTPEAKPEEPKKPAPKATPKPTSPKTGPSKKSSSKTSAKKKSS